jgi:hypothetical protein
MFDKLSETQHVNYARLLRDDYWAGRHVRGRHAQDYDSYVKPGCGFVPSEFRKSARHTRRQLLIWSRFSQAFVCGSIIPEP